jgi:hypothetical protein
VVALWEIERSHAGGLPDYRRCDQDCHGAAPCRDLAEDSGCPLLRHDMPKASVGDYVPKGNVTSPSPSGWAGRRSLSAAPSGAPPLIVNGTESKSGIRGKWLAEKHGPGGPPCS